MCGKDIQEAAVEEAVFHFVFPFTIKRESQYPLKDYLDREGFLPYILENEDLQGAYYGDYRVLHRNLEHYFLPFTAKIFFPAEQKEKGFQRYSKKAGVRAVLRTGHAAIGFQVLSLDVFICPFSVGFITFRIQLEEEASLTEALEFASAFRVLERRTSADKETVIEFEGRNFPEVERFLFKELLQDITSYFHRENTNGAYFETLTNFTDERMYVQGILSLKEKETLGNENLFRAGKLYGLDRDGKADVGASDPEYISDYVKAHVYRRWSPNTFYTTDEGVFCCITNEQGDKRRAIGSQMLGEYYYALLFNLFHKIVLLRLSDDYSKVELERDIKKVEKLIRSITHFSSNYFFQESNGQVQGKEIFKRLRRVLETEEMYEDVRETLASLFRYQESFGDKRNNYLLMILTIYTVISGIYGMNQVIEDLKGNIKWGKMLHYSIFQYIALVVTLSGIAVGATLGFYSIKNWITEKKRKRDYY
ncbi:hypothetical protein [Peribacillus sp. SCS-37]|uniref:hypothetical protein n=1 Tax=Paraperibacillus esterisolvens TaxID=3115296 RepID=UPI003905FB1D